MADQDFQEAVTLGKKLVEELCRADENEVDTLSQWMSHYIAELITKAESAEGSEAEQIRRDCKNTILELWNHRSGFADRGPLSELEPLIATLQALQPEHTNPFYHQEVLRKMNKKNVSGKSSELLNAALNVDYLARLWISELIKEAVTSSDDKRAAWVKAAKPLVSKPDSLLGLAEWLENQEAGLERAADLIKKRQQERLERVETFISFAMQYRNALEKDLTFVP